MGWGDVPKKFWDLDFLEQAGVVFPGMWIPWDLLPHLNFCPAADNFIPCA